MSTLSETFFYQYRDPKDPSWSYGSRAYDTREQAEQHMNGNAPHVTGRRGRVLRRADEVVAAYEPPPADEPRAPR